MLYVIVFMVSIGVFFAWRRNVWKLQMAAAWAMFSVDVLVMKPEFVVRDLMTCIRSTLQKFPKRKARLEIVLLQFKDVLPKSLIDEAILLMKRRTKEYAQSGIKKNITITQIESCFQQQDCDIFQSSGLFDDAAYDPVREELNGFAKTAVNESGYVYDIMTYVAVIALKRFKGFPFGTGTLKNELVKNCALIMKGGASVGKFVLRSKSSRVFDLFIKGGDNDTSLKFPLRIEGFNDDEIYFATQELLECFINILENVMVDFDVEKIIMSYLDVVDGEYKKIRDKQILLRKSKSCSFAIKSAFTVSDEQYMQRVNTSVPRHIFYTRSSLDFVSKSRRSNFHLGRIKASYDALYIKNNEYLKCKVNAELLDVSVMTPYSTKHDVSYRKLRVSDIL